MILFWAMTEEPDYMLTSKSVQHGEMTIWKPGIQLYNILLQNN